MAAHFFDASGLDRWFTFNPQSFAETAGRLIRDPAAVILIGEEPAGVVGMTGALSYPCWFDVNHLTAQEWLWWVEPEHRGGPMGAALRNGLEGWARENGCLTMEMGALEASRPEALARLYESKGYAPKERIFCRRLT